MKKFLLTLLAATAMGASLNVQAETLTEGKQYVVLNQAHSEQPEVIEFFSFYCSHCYDFETKYNIPSQLKADLPEGASFKQYHVNFSEQFADLIRAWALAMALKVEDKVKMPLFKAAQSDIASGNFTLGSMDNIRQIFIDNGVSAEQFDAGINSFVVNSLVAKQINAAKQFEVQFTPAVYVNGKFHIDPKGLDRNDFAGDYVKTIKELLKK